MDGTPQRVRFSSRRMFAQLVAGLSLLTVAVVVLAWLSLDEHRHHYEERAIVSARNLAQLIEHDINAVVSAADRAVLTVKAEYESRLRRGPVSATSMNEFIAQQKSWRPEIFGLRLVNERGIVVQGAGAIQRAGVNVSGRDYFKTLLRQRSDDLVISGPVQGRISDTWLIVFARALRRPDGSFAGAVTASIPLTEFSRTFSQLSVGPDGLIALIDEKPQIIVRSPELPGAATSVGMEFDSPRLIELLRTHQPSGTIHFLSKADGVERVHAYRSIGATPFKIVVGLATADYLAEWRSEMLKTAVIVAALVLVIVLLTWFVYRALRVQDNAVDALQKVNATLDAEKHLTATIVESSPFAIYTRDRQGIVTAWNTAAEKLFGWRADEIVGKPLFSVPSDKQQETEELREQVLSGESILQREVQRQKRDGTRFDMSTTLAPLRDAQGRIDGYLAIATDITERKAAEERIEFLAYRDVLTGLPNRLLLQDRFIQTMAYAERSGQKVALLFLDLDNFKTINDSLGHSVGDALLRQVTSRLGECVRESDTIGRQGGDEFLIVLPDIRGADAITPVLLKIRDHLQAPYEIDGNELSTSVSIGVAIYPDDGRDFDTLLKKADTAMYRAKDAGRNGYRFFDEQMNVEAVEHLQLKNGLRRAVERSEFVLHYQPQIDLVSGAVVGVEALIRWNHPEQGLVAPVRFITLAEESGLIVPIGDWVIHEACRQAMAWRQSGLPPLVMAVNLSAVQFKRGDVEQTVTQALQATGFDPHCLELELTESLLIHNTEQVLASVKRLKLLGVRLSIDDFGTGYSSLSYLKRFDVDKLKIDRSFVRDLAVDPDDAAIINAIVQMARSLNLKTVAEGVETVDMLSRLRQFHCDQAQGYYFAKPMPAADFGRYLTEQHTLLGAAI